MMNDAVQLALALYGFSERGCQPIRHNENRTYHITDKRGEFLLRIHTPARGFEVDALLEPPDRHERLGKELHVLQHLAARGMQVQSPVLSKHGRPYETLADGELVSVLTWIRGGTLGEQYTNHLPALGRLMADLHRASAGLEGGIRYGTQLVLRMDREIGRAITLGHITQTAGETCKRALDVIARAMEATDDAGIGFIHSDLSFGNIIVNGGDLVPIDFSLSGTGCFAQDVGMMLTQIPEAPYRNVVAAAYEKEMGIRLDPHSLDAFFCMSILLFICAQHWRFHEEPWFRDRMMHWCGQYFEALVQGKRVALA